MIQKEVKASVPEKKDKDGKIVQEALGETIVSVNYGETVEESIQLFGGEPLNTNAFQHWKVVVQSWIRAQKKAGDSDEVIRKAALGLKMGVAAAGRVVDTEADYRALFLNSTPEEQAKMIKELTSKAQK